MPMLTQACTAAELHLLLQSLQITPPGLNVFVYAYVYAYALELEAQVI